MTETPWVLLLDGVAAHCSATKAEARVIGSQGAILRAVAERLKSSPEGWDHEVFVLEQTASNLEARATAIANGVRALARLGDGLLDETQQGPVVRDDDE